MALFTLEHGKVAYRADFAIYGGALILMAASLVFAGPPRLRFEIAGLALAGLASWTAIEYVLHRFVLHGIQPFRRWHREHHLRPTALICTPTVLSATLIAALVFLPALLLGDLWRACAVTLGLSSGYLVYAVTHHAIHHWRADRAWLKRRKRLHGAHHHIAPDAFYGVTTSFWDHAFGTARKPGAPER